MCVTRWVAIPRVWNARPRERGAEVMDFFLSLGLWRLVVGATLPFTSEGGRQLGVKVLLASSSVVLLLGAWLLTSRVGSSQPLLVASLTFLALMATALISAVRSDSPALLLIHSPAWAVLTLGFLWKMRELVGVLETDLNDNDSLAIYSASPLVLVGKFLDV